MKTVPARMALVALSLVTLATSPVAMAAAKEKAAKGKAAKVQPPKKAVCPVCAVKEGKKELEPVKASLKYKGKTYYFCNLQDKAEFISNPAKYAGAVK
jgi:YHS domain-containing protein